MRYNIALCIPTRNSAAMVQDFLERCSSHYIGTGIDIYYYDSSEDDATKEVVCGWEKNKNHIHYIRMPAETTLAEKQLHILMGRGLKKSYDFLSLSNDSTQYSAKVIQQIVNGICLEYDFIVYSNDKELKTRTYTNPDLFLLECGRWSMHLGGSMMNVHTMLNEVDWDAYRNLFDPVSGEYSDVISMGAYYGFYFRRFLEMPSFRAMHLEIERRSLSPLKRRSMYYNMVIPYLCEGWVRTFRQIPDEYTNKWIVCRATASQYVSGTKSAFLLLRSQKQYYISHFFQYWSVWKKITPVPRRSLFWIACIPPKLIIWFYEQRKRIGKKKLEDFCRRHSQVYVYGAGNHGSVYGKYLDSIGQPYVFCATTVREEKKELMGRPIFAIDQVVKHLDGVGFIVAMTQRNAKSVLGRLTEEAGKEHIFYDEAFDIDLRSEFGYQSFGGT